MKRFSGEAGLPHPQRRRLLGLAAACVAATAVFSCRNDEPKSFAPGDRFPDLALPGLDGQAVPPASRTGAALIVNFWATWCGPCRHEMPGLEKLSKLFHARDLLVIGIAVDSDRNLAREFSLQHKLTFPMLSDSGQALSSNVLRIPAYPSTYMLKRDRTIARIIIGARDWASPKMIGEIEEALAVRHISAPATASIN